MTVTPPPIVFARTITERTDAEVVKYARMLPELDSKNRAADRLAHRLILDDAVRRLDAWLQVERIGCTADRCLYPDRPGLTPGVDVSIDGDIWPGSPYARHLERCPSRRRTTAVDAAAPIDAGTMDAIRRVRAFQHQADAAGYGKPQLCGTRNPRNGWICSLLLGPEHADYVRGRHVTLFDGDRMDWYDTEDGQPRDE